MRITQTLKNVIVSAGLVGLLAGGCSDLNKYFGKEEPKKEKISYGIGLSPEYNQSEIKKEVYCDANLMEKVNESVELSANFYSREKEKYKKINVEGKLVKIEYFMRNEGIYCSLIDIDPQNIGHLSEIKYSFKYNNSFILVSLSPKQKKEECDDNFISVYINGWTIKNPQVRKQIEKEALEFGYKILDTQIQLKQKYLEENLDKPLKAEDIIREKRERKKAEATARKAFGVK